MKVEDFMGAVDTDALQAEEDSETFHALFRAYQARELEQIRRALRRRLGLSEDQNALLVELLNDTIDRRGWAGDDFHDDDEEK